MPVEPFSAIDVRSGRRRVELAVLVTVFVASAMFALAERQLLFAAICAIGVIVHALAAWRHVEIHAHRMVLNGSVLVVSAVLLARYLSSDEDILISLGHYVTLIQLCKLFERKKSRDYVQVLVMSLLLVLAGAMKSQDLLFALLGLGYLLSLSYAAMALMVWRSLTAALQQETFLARLGPGWRGWPGRAVLGRLGVVVIAMIATAVAVFLVAPRGAGGGAPPLRVPSARGAGGMADTVRLGEPKSLYLSDRIVLRMVLRSPGGEDLGPSGLLYLRGRSFHDYVDSRWRTPVRRRQHFPPQPLADVLNRTVRQEVQMLPSLLPMAFATYPAVAVSSSQVVVRTFDDLEYDLKPPQLLDSSVRYTARVLTGPLSPRARAYLRAVTPRPRYEDLAGLEVSPRVELLARQWCADPLRSRRGRQDPGAGPQDLAIARRLASRLKQRCRYTLDLTGADPDRDAVDDFLFRLRAGHCEYFASALTVMCQALDVRARLSTGFCAHAYDAEAGCYVVRQRDAHAWTEVYTDQTGWVVVDATPSGRFSPPAGGGLGRWWTRARDVWWRWEFSWHAEVIGYDNQARRQLGSWMRNRAAGGWQAVKRAALAVFWGLVELFARGRISEAVVWFFGGMAAVTGAIAAGLILLRFRRPARRGWRAAPAPKPPAFFVHLLHVLHRHGLGRDPSRTPRELARQAVEQLHVPAGALDEVVSLYYRIRWSRGSASAEEIRAAEQHVRRIGEILSA